MILEGIITRILLPMETGISKAGKAYMKANYVLTTNDKFPTETKFDVFGEDRIKELNLQVGQRVKLEGQIESREFNDKWYSDVHIWRRIEETASAN